MKNVTFDYAGSRYVVSFPDSVKVEHRSCFTGDDSVFFWFDGVLYPIADVLSGDFGFLVNDISNRKKSIYCTDEEFSIAKSIIDMMRRADKGVYSAVKFFTLSQNCIQVSLRKEVPEDTII